MPNAYFNRGNIHSSLLGVGDGRSLEISFVSSLPRLTLGKGEGWALKPGVGRGGRTFPADHLFAVIFASQGLEGGFDDAAAKAEDEVEG